MTPQRDARGVLAAWLAYGIWGLFPLYFHALRPAGATEIPAHRVIWTFVLCVVVLLLRTELVALLRQLRGRSAPGRRHRRLPHRHQLVRLRLRRGDRADQRGRARLLPQPDRHRRSGRTRPG
uniref:Uncharacterized protein n=1 Tax=Janibacter limosus TaxID=53458 RepID=A0AC61U5U9_9MICO|nr:hypothetical protein [Janibacter limosus]